MEAPLAATCAASPWLTDGLTVLMSTYTSPGSSPASTPASPSAMASRAPSLAIMEKVTSEASATCRGVSASSIPMSTSHWARDLVRL